MATELVRKHRFTTDDYHRMGETGILAPEARVELIDGEVVEMSPIGSRHMRIVNRLTEEFVVRFRGRAVVSVQNPVRLGRHSEPQPDLALLRKREDDYRGGPPLAPDVLLLVEVADTTAEADRRLKAPLYALHGIVEFWLVDLDDATVTVYRDPAAEGYRSVTRTARGGSLAALAFPEHPFTVAGLLD